MAKKDQPKSITLHWVFGEEVPREYDYGIEALITIGKSKKVERTWLFNEDIDEVREHILHFKTSIEPIELEL